MAELDFACTAESSTMADAFAHVPQKQVKICAMWHPSGAASCALLTASSELLDICSLG